MEVNKVLTFIILVMLSAFFSGSETALFSLPRVFLKKIENESKGSSSRVLRLLRKPRRLLITLLMGNTFVNMAISSLAALWALDYFEDQYSSSLILTFQVLATTVVVLLLGEIIPKLFALATAERFSRLASLPLIILQFMLYPLGVLFEGLGKLLSGKSSIDKHLGADFTSEEFHDLIQSESSVKVLHEHEKKMLAGLARVREAQVKEVMVPRVHISAIEETQELDELKELILSSGYSRIPVFRQTIDDIIGVIYVKDLLIYPEKRTVSELHRPAWFVTENMKLQTLLNQFKSRKMQVAIVVDEYGGTAGIITLEDILEEIVGEIRDEYDHDETPELIRIDQNHFILSGLYSIRQFNQEFYADIDPEEFDNIAEYILSHFNHVPVVGEGFDLEQRLHFRVRESDEKSIKSIDLEIREENNE